MAANYSKTFLLVGLLFALVLILSSDHHVSAARELAEAAQTQGSVEDDKHRQNYGHWGHEHGHGHWGHDDHHHDGHRRDGHHHGKPGHGGAGGEN